METGSPPSLPGGGGIFSLSEAPGGADVVAFYYDHHQQGAVQPPLPGVESIQLSPSLSALLDANSLHFTDVPGLLQRALLWDSGLLPTSDADDDRYANGGLVQIFTRCGTSMSDIALSEHDVSVAGCSIDSCAPDANMRAVKYSSHCLFDDTETDSRLLAVAKCAVVPSHRLDTPEPTSASDADVRIWSNGALDGSWTLDELQPQISTVAGSVGDTLYPAAFSVIRLGQAATVPSDLRDGQSARCQSPRSVAIPCAQLDAPPTNSEDWCYPTPSPLLRQWLLELQEVLAASDPPPVSSSKGSGISTTIGITTPAHPGTLLLDALAGTSGISVPDAAARDVGASLTSLWPTTSTTSDAIAMSSDLARQYYRLRDRGSGLDFQLSKSVDVPEEVVDRLRPFQIGFNQLSGLLRLALLWDSGYVLATDAQDDDRALLVPVWVRCGLRMSDLALSRAAFEFSGCGAVDCSTFNTTTNTSVTSLRSDTSSASCSPAKLATATACAADTAALGERNVSLAHSDAAIWSVGPLSSSSTHVISHPTIKRHQFEHTVAPAELYTIHTHYAMDALEQQTIGGHECPRTPSLTVPCVPLELVHNDQSEDWCRPVPSELVSAWLVVEERQYRTLFHLVALGVAVILAIAVDLYFDRKPRRVRAAASVGAVAMPSVASSALDFDPDRASSTHLSAMSAMSGMSSRQTGDPGDW